MNNVGLHDVGFIPEFDQTTGMILGAILLAYLAGFIMMPFPYTKREEKNRLEHPEEYSEKMEWKNMLIQIFWPITYPILYYKNSGNECCLNEDKSNDKSAEAVECAGAAIPQEKPLPLDEPHMQNSSISADYRSDEINKFMEGFEE